MAARRRFEAHYEGVGMVIRTSVVRAKSIRHASQIAEVEKQDGEFVRGVVETPGPLYSYADILALAGKPDQYGWRFAEVEIEQGEQAVNPASTKHSIPGPAKIEYRIHPSGIDTVLR